MNEGMLIRNLEVEHQNEKIANTRDRQEMMWKARRREESKRTSKERKKGRHQCKHGMIKRDVDDLTGGREYRDPDNTH